MNESLHTLEVRWFRRGATPSGVLEWFLDCEPEPEHDPIRNDLYLRLPSTGGVGVKLREGHLETKVRGQTLGVVQLHAGVRGAVERWTKWRFALAEEAGAASHSPSLSPSWISVTKQRLRRRYTLARASKVVRVESGVYPICGCNLELTRVEVPSGDWWTLCFEAYGDESSLAKTLSLVASHTLAAGEPPVLDDTASCGYPAWLGEIG